MIRQFALFMLVIVVGWTSYAADLYVSPAGSDSAPGTKTAPWKTVQKAASSAKAGDVVNIRAGVYKEFVQITVSGTAAARITFQSAPGELAVLDGTGLKLPAYEAPLIRMVDRDYITIKGLELRNVSSTSDATVPMGILISGAANGIEIRNCSIHDISQNNATKYNGNANAHGIGVYGNSRTPNSKLVIDSCEIYNLRLGASESVALNGNVTGFSVTNNIIHDNNNIGIDFIGYEGTCKDAAQDRARDGVCCANKVYNIDSRTNPAYGGSFTSGGGDPSSDGIYVDGGTRIVIERNEVWNCNIGIELASENRSGVTDAVTVRDNVIRQNHVTGLSLGGYASNTGATKNCTVTNNTLVANDTLKTWSGQIQLQYYISGCTIKNNIIQASPSTHQMIVHSISTALGTGNVIDYNLYYYDKGAASSLEFDLANKSYTTLLKWQATGFDKNSLFSAPGFASTTNGKCDLGAGAAAIDRADPALMPASTEKDFNAKGRLAGKCTDIGAMEYGSK